MLSKSAKLKRKKYVKDAIEALGGYRAALNPFTSIRKALDHASGGNPSLRRSLAFGAQNFEEEIPSFSAIKYFARSTIFIQSILGVFSALCSSYPRYRRNTLLMLGNISKYGAAKILRQIIQLNQWFKTGLGATAT